MAVRRKPPARLPVGERRERDVRVPVSAAEGAELDAWATRQGRKLAALAREALLAEARRDAKRAE
jgi:hypothetical protein